MQHPLLEGFQFIYPITVVWGEMDAFQHVNNVVYFRYFESARVAYGHEVRMMDPKQNAGVAPILAATQARYKRPVTFPDQLLVGVRVSRMASNRFWQQYHIVSTTQNVLTTEGEAEIVMFDYKAGTKTTIPDAMKQRIEALEKREFVIDAQ